MVVLKLLYDFFLLAIRIRSSLSKKSLAQSFSHLVGLPPYAEIIPDDKTMDGKRMRKHQDVEIDFQTFAVIDLAKRGRRWPKFKPDLPSLLYQANAIVVRTVIMP